MTMGLEGTNDDRMRLDGSQRARLVNMRINNTTESKLPVTNDFMSTIHGERNYLLKITRDSNKKAVNHWFMRGQGDYAPEEQMLNSGAALRSEYVKSYANRSPGETLKDAEEDWEKMFSIETALADEDPFWVDSGQ